jgi:hypothetical protein
MRSLILVTTLCLAATPAFACVFDTDCKPGTICLDGLCTHALNSDTDDDNAPAKQPSTSKSCDYDSDCSPGSRCIKGSGIEGVCIGGH